MVHSGKLCCGLFMIGAAFFGLFISVRGYINQNDPRFCTVLAYDVTRPGCSRIGYGCFQCIWIVFNHNTTYTITGEYVYSDSNLAVNSCHSHPLGVTHRCYPHSSRSDHMQWTKPVSFTTEAMIIGIGIPVVLLGIVTVLIYSSYRVSIQLGLTLREVIARIETETDTDEPEPADPAEMA